MLATRVLRAQHRAPLIKFIGKRTPPTSMLPPSRLTLTRCSGSMLTKPPQRSTTRPKSTPPRLPPLYPTPSPTTAVKPSSTARSRTSKSARVRPRRVPAVSASHRRQSRAGRAPAWATGMHSRDSFSTGRSCRRASGGRRSRRRRWRRLSLVGRACLVEREGGWFGRVFTQSQMDLLG